VEEMLTIYGSTNSPYSIKVRSYARYKNIPHTWKTDIRHGQTQKEYQQVAKLPLVPAIRTISGKGMQDSTPIMDYLDRQYPTTISTHPPNELNFISILLEEFGDEWANKWMFHYRWQRPIDQRIVSLRLVNEMLANNGTEETMVQMADQIRQRMSGRGFAVGSNVNTAPLIERSFKSGVAQIELHLATRPYLFGKRPSFGDFGVAAQMYQALIDPTAGEHLINHAPRVVQWCTALMVGSPVVHASRDASSDEWEQWETLAPTLLPFLTEQVGELFLTWSHANSQCIVSGKKLCLVELHKYGTWANKVGGPQKYQHKSLQALRKKYKMYSSKGLDDILKNCKCFDVLNSSSQSKL